ncbi:MAG: AbrB/MazE/SpoVT family DNA-binding domain-containing protein [Candidatus Syntropharchaeia archaeon]
MVRIRTVGKKGQVTIPKEIREKFGLKEEYYFEQVEKDVLL